MGKGRGRRRGKRMGKELVRNPRLESISTLLFFCLIWVISYFFNPESARRGIYQIETLGYPYCDRQSIIHQLYRTMLDKSFKNGI
jgi:hypothetical protein